MRHLLLYLIISVSYYSSFAQNTGIGVGTTNPHPSAAFEISSSNQGFLPPRMTTVQRNSIQNPVSGLQIYNTTTDCLEIYGKGKWNAIYCVPIDTTSVTDIDGNTYPTVKICEQTWMAKNLDVTRYRNGDIIPQVTDPTQWANLTTGAWCWYNNDSANGSIYGKLYNWYAVNDSRGIAPQGWYIPKQSEWDVLLKCVDSNADTTVLDWQQNTIAGSDLKSDFGWSWNGSSGNGSNNSGFTGLPAGVRHSNGSFDYVGGGAYWWAKNNYDNLNAWLFGLNIFPTWVYRNFENIRSGLSIRCLKDAPPPSTLDSGLVAYYPFNGNANDESGNGNNGTVNGATLTTDRFGSAGNAFAFGGNEKITIAHSNSLLVGNQMTISVWYNRGTMGSNTVNYILQKGTGSSCTNTGYYCAIDYGFGSIIDGQKVLSWGINNNCAAIGENRTIPSGWHHLVFVYSPGSSHKIYIDGSLIINPSNNPCQNCLINDTQFPLVIGGYYSTYPGGANWNGKLDDIRIYNRALTQAEVTYLATH